MDVLLLGPVEALVDGRPVALGATKQRAVLAMLALQAGQTVSVDRLAEGLWGEEVPRSAHKMVQHYVSQLRRALDGGGTEIVTRGRGYELRLAAGASDVQCAERLLDGGTAREALALWRGAPLADVAGEPFAAAEIRRLEELRSRALEQAIDADLAAGRHREVLAEIDALAAEQRFSERLHAQRMLALYRSGRQAEALEAFHEARRVLVDEIGVEPGPDLRALHDAILRHDPALEAPRARPASETNLPPLHRGLIGREAELRSLRDLLAHGDERLVTLLGLGGTGKTHLAMAAGHALLPAFEGGAWLVPLAGVRDPAAIVPAVAAAIGVGDAGGRPVADAVAERLHDRRALLVLDNFEQLAEGAPHVAELLDRAPAARVIVTSQLPLRIARERVIRLEPLEPADAERLFAERAAAVSPGFDGAAHHEAIAAICERLDGLPLAVELAAARISVMSPGDLLARLERSLAVLARGPRDLPDRHRSLRATLEWADDLLEPVARTLLARLAAFAGPAPLDAVEAVAAVAGERGSIDALDALSGLVDASLVRRRDDDVVRYDMPQAVREFAAARLAASGEEAAVRAAHAEHLASRAEACRAWFPGHPDAARRAVAALDAEQRVALEWTRAHAPALHLRLASALGMIMARTGRTREAHDELGVALEGVAIDGPEAGWAALVRAYTSLSLGDRDAHLAGAGLAAIRASGDAPLLAAALRLVSVHSAFTGDPGGALAAAEEAVAIERRRADPAALAAALLTHADALIEQRRLDEAEAAIAEAEALLPATGDSTLIIGTSRGDLALARGDWALAVCSYAESAAASHALGSTEQLLLDLQFLALALVPLGEEEGALELEAVAAAIEDETGESGIEDTSWSSEWDARREQARRTVGPERAAAAAARGRALPATERAARGAALAAAAVR